MGMVMTNLVSLLDYRASGISLEQLWETDHPLCQFQTGKEWLDLQFHTNDQIKKPDELENEIVDPPGSLDQNILDRIQGSLIGLALGDALGAHVEFRSHQYLLANPVIDLEGGGTWSLKKGQFTDDTSMALCLANSLVARHGFVPYDQLVRYKWWYQNGYMASTGKCFNTEDATRQSLDEFIRRQNTFAKKYKISVNKLDYLSDDNLLRQFDVCCSKSGVAGNGALMRLAPVPLFFYQHPEEAIEYSGVSGKITHGDRKAYDACRYYGALIFVALNGGTKDDLLAERFFENHKSWFGDKPLCSEIRMIAEGSYKKKGGYEDGIRGKGYIVNALEAALWAFWSDENSFEKGVLAVVNLGDDTDTTAAIYGQLAGAHYGYKGLPEKWVEQVYAKKFILQLSKWLAYEGKQWKETEVIIPSKQSSGGAISSASFENLSSQEPATRYRQPLKQTSSGTLPTRRKPAYNTSSPPTTKPSSTSTSTPNSSHNNDRLSNQHASPHGQHNDTTTVNVSRKDISREQRPSDGISTSKSEQGKSRGNEITPPNMKRISSGCYNMNLTSSSPSTPSSSHKNDGLSNQHASSHAQYNDTITANVSQKEISSEQRPSDGISTSKSGQEKSGDNETAPPSMKRISGGTSTLTSTPIDYTVTVLNQKDEAAGNVLITLRPTPSVLNGTKPELSHVIGSSAKAHNITGYRLLNFVDNDALSEFGVTSSYNRRVILDSIRQLKDRQATPVTLKSADAGDFYSEFAGDFVPRLYLTDSTYPNTMSCILKPLEDKTHSMPYDQILKWLGPLPSDISIDKIELVHNAESYRMFLQQITRIERKQTQEAFQPHLDAETNPTERKKVLDRLQALIQQVNHSRAAPIVRVWHGCKRSVVAPLVSDGFAALGKLDNGWFGKAMYFTSSAEYATTYTGPTGCLIMCYVVLLNPFPVITDDALPSVSSKRFRFYGTGNYSNYQCHYIPVAPVNESTSWNFRPPPGGVQDAPFDELAIFQQSDILPQVIVHLKPKTNSVAPSPSNENVERIFLFRE